jgi:formylglycine-generating enzyme required for sulfatase activity
MSISHKGNANAGLRRQTLLAILVVGALIGLVATATAATPDSDIIGMEMVTVGDINNPKDMATKDQCGSVGYEYQIGKYEVTNAQYVAFLNAVAKTDPYDLYNSEMDNKIYGGITRSGASGSYSYAVKVGMDANGFSYADRPVNYVSFYDAARFTNWLTTGETETGVYNLLGESATPTNGTSVTRTLDQIPGTLWAVASEDEWYKAAYYNGNETNTYRTYPVTGTLSQNTANYSVGEDFAFPSPHLTEVDHYDAVDGASSFYGTFQQGGNLWEWNDTIKSNYLRGVRGGAFEDDNNDLASSTFFPNASGTSTYFIGFRVVALSSLAVVPEPNTCAAAMGLMMLIVSLWRRRGRSTL